MSSMTVILKTFLMLVCHNLYTYGYVDKLNVGTVLFSPTDIERECWDWDSLTLLSSRMIFENLLVFKELLVVNDNSFVVDLVDYYRLLIDVIRNHTDGRIKRIMLLALADFLGGYLQRFILPSARDSYYAGYINYSSMEMLYKLFDELKDYLKTNGKGWTTRSCPPQNKFIVKSLALRRKNTADPCSLISLIEKTGTTSVEIPLPFTDSRTKPAAIAVPFKSHTFVGTESKASSFILVKYYVNSLLCLRKQNANKSELGEFNSGLVNWLDEYVIPLLCSEKFYPAFGGVLRIIETAKNEGLKPYGSKTGHFNTVQEIPETDVEKFEGDQRSSKKRSNLILMSLLCTIFLWFLLGSIFICCRFRAGKRKDYGCPCTPSKSSSGERTSNIRTSASQSSSEPNKSRQPTAVSQSFSEPNKSRQSSVIRQSFSEANKSRQSSVVSYAEVKHNKNTFFMKDLTDTTVTRQVYSTDDAKSTALSRYGVQSNRFDSSGVTFIEETSQDTTPSSSESDEGE